MKKLIVGALLALALAVGGCRMISQASAEDGWYLVAPIQADGHRYPFASYNEDPYADEDECVEVLASDEFAVAFHAWQEYEYAAHEGQVQFGKPVCKIILDGDPA